MKYIGTYILGRLAPRLVFLHSWIPDTFARVVCNNMWSPLELIGKTCTAALTQPVCNPRSAMQCNGLNCMYVHLQWFTVWNKLGRPALLNLIFFGTLNISTTHKWTNGYVIQMQMQKLQILAGGLLTQFPNAIVICTNCTVIYDDAFIFKKQYF